MSKLVFILASLAFGAEDFRLKPPPDAVTLLTPDGEKQIVFDTGEKPKSYRVAIPVSQLKPAPTPTPSPAPVAETEKKEEVREVAALPTPTPSLIPSPSPELVYDDSDSLILEANHLFNRGDFFNATLKVDVLLKRNPKMTRAWVMKGTLLHVQGFKDLARNAWEKAYELSEKKDAEVKKLLEKYR